MCVGVVALGWVGHVSLGLHSGRCNISLGCSREVYCREWVELVRSVLAGEAVAGLRGCWLQSALHLICTRTLYCGDRRIGDLRE